VDFREFFLDQFAGDLEYHPRRAAVYLVLAISAASWFVSAGMSFTTVPLIFALGGLALAIKGIFLLRRSSEGLGLSQQEVSRLSDGSNEKQLPNVPVLASQLLQDFGAGPLLLGPLISIVVDEKGRSELPHLRVAIVGACVFGVGWVLRRLTANPRS
jgi:hypothetical protein